MYSINVFHTDVEDGEMHASVAQRIEQEPSNLLVGGSIPSWGTCTHERRSLKLRERRSLLVLIPRDHLRILANRCVPLFLHRVRVFTRVQHVLHNAFFIGSDP